MTELRQRLLFVVGALLVYRIGSHIPIPGIDPERLAALFQSQQGTIVDLFNIFSGGALERMSIFALNIVPYISASIIMQIMGVVHKPLAQLRKEGEQGRREINRYTRYLTVLLALVQAVSLSIGLANQGLATVADANFFVVAITGLVAGTVFLMWLGEQITERGIGNGISLIIFASIVSGIPGAIGQSLEQARQGELNVLLLIAIVAVVVGVTGFVVMFERAQRRITVHYARRGAMGGSQVSHLPLKINLAGVIPAIFASSVLLFPASLSTWFGQNDSLGWLTTFSLALAPGTPLYVLMFTAMIFFFCYFYAALLFNPAEVAENLRKSGAFIPGHRAGRNTASYIDGVISRLTFFGAAYMTAVCLLPLALVQWGGVSFFFGGTSLLIVVVVVMDFMTQVQAHLMSFQYDSVLKKANLHNIRSSGAVR